MKRNLQGSTIQQDRILSSKNNLIHDVESKKEKSSNKKYNLRLREKTEKQNEEHLNDGSLTKLKTLPNKNTINEVTKDIYTKSSSVKNKENKIIQSESRRGVKTNICPNFKISSNFVKKSNKVLEDGNKISKSKNLNKNVNLNLNRKRFETSGNVNLTEALNHEKNWEEKNLITNKIEDKHDIIANNAKKVPIWRRNLSTNLPKQSIKRKDVDMYDISKDEDILSDKKNEKKSKKKKTKTAKKLSGFVKDRKMLLLSNGRSKIIKKSSSSSKPLQTKQMELNIGQPMPNKIPNESKVAEVNKCYHLQENLNKLQNVNINIQSNNIQNEQIKSNVGQPVFNETPNKSEVKELNTCHQLLQNLNEIQNVETNVQNYNILTSFEVSPSFDEIHPETETRSNNETLLMAVADQFEQSVLIPKMTSTPDPTALVKTKNQLQINLKKLDVSHIVSKDRQCLKTVYNVQKHLLTNNNKVKKSDINLFESPSKKPKQNADFKFKAPKNCLQIDSMEGFSSPSSVENVEDSLIKPKKAYHTPDAKVHIARIKRTSEIMRDVIKKSKEDLLIEKLSNHFAEISSTELCIE